MAPRFLRASVTTVAGLAALLTVGGTGTLVARAAQAAGDRTLFVNVFDAAKAPLPGLTAADFQVREDGAVREIASVSVSTDPVFVSLLLDTTADVQEAVTDLRKAATTFVRDLLAGNPQAQVTVVEFAGAVTINTKATSKFEDLEKGISRIFPKRGAGAVLNEALIESSRDLARKPGARRVIVSVNVEPSDEQSEIQPRRLGDEVRKSGASVWAFSVQRGSGLTGRNTVRDGLLVDLAGASGGFRGLVPQPGALESTMKLVAEHLLSTYAVTIKRGDAPPWKQTQVGVNRPGARAATLTWNPK